jgi:hypothetical protein
LYGADENYRYELLLSSLVSESVVCFCSVITMNEIDETHVG